MRELTNVEYITVSGGLPLTERLEGLLWRIGDGAMTGMSIGGEWICGDIPQLAGYGVTLSISGAISAVGGAFYDREPSLLSCRTFTRRWAPEYYKKLTAKFLYFTGPPAGVRLYFNSEISD